jgi:hypothetical protein
MFPGNEDSPTAFNTASVGYLWSSYNFTTGEYIPGTHGYYVRIYDDKVVFLGRDFEKNEFIPSAIFVAQKNTIDLPSDEITTTTDADAINIDAEIGGGKEPVFTSSDYKIASVTDEGTIIPKKAGDVKITVTAPGTSTTTVNRKIVNVHIEEGIDEFTDWEFNENSKTHSRRNVDTGVVQYKACNTDDHKVEKAATTSEDGVFNCYCSVCGGRQSNEVIRKIGEITAYDVMYTGRETSPKVRVLDADGKTIPAEYYTVEKAGKAIGKYKVKITFKDWYSGEVTKTVKVVPKGTSISSVKSSSKKAMTVKWKKQTSQTTGYQIQYSTTKDFSSGNKTITIKKNKTTSRTIKKLKSGKTYYVRVRTYKTKSGVKYYSSWSDVKSVKVK